MMQTLKRIVRQTAKRPIAVLNPRISQYMSHSGLTLEQAQRRVGKIEQSGKSIVVDGVTYKFI